MNDINIQYKRSGSTSYMIIPVEYDAPEHERRMLENNEIKVLLPFFCMSDEEGASFWYDITGKKALKVYLETVNPGKKEIYALLIALFEACEKMNEYLISLEHIIMDENTVYISTRESGCEIGLCYCPDGNKGFEEQLTGLFEYILSVMSHDDEVLVSEMYDMYTRLCEGGFILKEAKDKIYRCIFEGEDEPAQRIQTEAIYREEKREEEDGIAEEESDDIYEQEEETHWYEGFLDFLSAIPDNIFSVFKNKREEYFPPKDLEEDIIYEPEKYIPKPTVMLMDGNNFCYGKLSYEGDGEEKDFTLKDEISRIGSRDESNEVLLHSAVVSRHHARILKKGRDYYVEDLNSTNGTFVNGEAVEVGEKRLLHPMDKLLFADVPYRIV